MNKDKKKLSLAVSHSAHLDTIQKIEFFDENEFVTLG